MPYALPFPGNACLDQFAAAPRAFFRNNDSIPRCSPCARTLPYAYDTARRQISRLRGTENLSTDLIIGGFAIVTE